MWRQPPLDRMSTLERTASLDALPLSRIAAPLQTTQSYRQTQWCHRSACILGRQENTRTNCPSAHKSCTRTRQKTITLNLYLKINLIKYRQHHHISISHLLQTIQVSRATSRTLPMVEIGLVDYAQFQSGPNEYPCGPHIINKHQEAYFCSYQPVKLEEIHLGPFS